MRGITANIGLMAGMQGVAVYGGQVFGGGTSTCFAQSAASASSHLIWNPTSSNQSTQASRFLSRPKHRRAHWQPQRKAQAEALEYLRKFTPYEEETRRILKIAANLTESRFYNAYNFLAQGKNGKIIRKQLQGIREIAKLLPTEDSRHCFFRFGLCGAMPLLERYGIKPFIEIARANPERAWVIADILGDLSDLVIRIGIGPFLLLVKKYPKNVERIFSEIRGRSFNYKDESGKLQVGYRHPILHSIRSASDLLLCAEQINAFLESTTQLERHNIPLGYFTEKYGIENLAHVGRMAAVMGKKALEWSFCELGVKRSIEEAKPLIDRFGFEFLTELYELTEGNVDAVVGHIDDLLDVYSLPSEIMAAVADILKIHATIRTKHIQESTKEESEKTDDWFSFYIFIRDFIAGLFGIAENRTLVKRFGLAGFKEALSSKDILPGDRYFAMLATHGHLVKSPEDFSRLCCTLDPLNVQFLERNLHLLANHIRTIEDLEKVCESYTQHARRSSQFLEMMPKLFPYLAHLIVKPSDFVTVSKRLCDQIPEQPINLVIPLFSEFQQDIKSSDDLYAFLSLINEIPRACSCRSYEDAKTTYGLVAKECSTLYDMQGWLALKKNRLIPTAYLLKELAQAEDKKATLSEWHATLASFAKGYFDPANELHRNLEYTRFRSIVDHEKVRRHVKGNTSFKNYIAIFERPAEPALASLSPEDRFEIECAAYEASLLEFFSLRVTEGADKLGMNTWMVPNLSYGYLPVAPLIPSLKDKGIEVVIGAKVGSTESHENKEVMDSKLLKGYRTRMITEQPVLLVVDGTYHLVERDSDNLGARYPDAYQGYLNQVIAINDAMGFKDVDYSAAGKTEEDIARLRSTAEFQRSVEVYEGIIKARSPKNMKPYSFQLWNTAGMDLTIRGGRKKLAEVPPFNPEKLSGPAIIFCNVGVLDEAIPQEIKQRYPNLAHKPAYFDDSGRIIKFNFGYDKYGIQYHNRLEDEIRRAYGVRKRNAISEFILQLCRRGWNRLYRSYGAQPAAEAI